MLAATTMPAITPAAVISARSSMRMVVLAVLLAQLLCAERRTREPDNTEITSVLLRRARHHILPATTDVVPAGIEPATFRV
jgi:hypothetical protein